jgi:hypothetical protein
MRQAAEVWSEAECLAFVDFVARTPETGDVIPESGGVRVIYFYYHTEAPLYLLMIYAKARQKDLSPDAKRAVQALAARLKRAHASARRKGDEQV